MASLGCFYELVLESWNNTASKAYVDANDIKWGYTSHTGWVKLSDISENDVMALALTEPRFILNEADYLKLFPSINSIS
jgi:hypothetical protein